MRVVLVGPEFEENLSLRYLAASLRQAGHRASLARFDSPEYVEGVVQQVRREGPGLVGLSMVFQVRAREFYELTRALRRSGYTGHITAGGHFATFAWEAMLRDLPELDTIVRQEGELTLVALADALQRGARRPDLVGIPGLVARGEGGEPVPGPPRRQVDDLDSLPLPVRDTPPERHLGVPTAYLISSRGCYADCEYCCIFAWHEAAPGKRYRMRRMPSVVEEMAWLYHQRGVRFFVFHDDNFFLPTPTGNRKRFSAFRDEIHARGLRDIGLMLKLRPNDCDRENLLILKELGLLRVFVGIENASQRQLKSLGRDTTVEQVEDCLELLRDLEVYATYNIILFDPYTTLEDVAANLQFLRHHLFYPFNWCKVEPYAGTELEKRFAREERLRGDYLGWDYRIDDPRAQLLYDLLLPAFYYRNFDYYGLANLNIGLGYHRQLLKHFYARRCPAGLLARAQGLVQAVNANALDLLERAYLFASEVDPADHCARERFGEQLKRESFSAQHELGGRMEAVLREIERAAGVRQEGLAGISEAFTPLSPLPNPGPPGEAGRPQPAGAVTVGGEAAPGEIIVLSPPPRPAGVAAAPTGAPRMQRPGRRRWLAAAAGGLAWLLSGCGRRPAPPPRVAPGEGSTPQGSLLVAEGRPPVVAAWEPFVLEAVLRPLDIQVIGEPRVTCTGGQIRRVEGSHGNHVLRIEYQPSGGSRELDPNETVSAAWTVRGPTSDMVVLAKAFVHLNPDGSYAFGYETPRPTIAEMAAPPIGRGPRPQ
jgi:anaerobic magnesium-protoporphyrin IX monomethyl ester cyclase